MQIDPYIDSEEIDLALEVMKSEANEKGYATGTGIDFLILIELMGRGEILYLDKERFSIVPQGDKRSLEDEINI